MNLPWSGRYIPAICEETRGELQVVEPAFFPEVLQDVYFMEQLKKKQHLSPQDRFRFFFIESNKESKLEKRSFDISIYQKLMLKNVIPSESFYLDEEQWDKFYQGKIILAAERFSGNLELSNNGSSRHAMLKHNHLKGIGRNMLATRLDFHHASGFMHAIESVQAYTGSIIAQRLCPLGAVQTHALYSHQEDPNRYFSLRELGQLRMAQLLDQPTRPSSKATYEKIVQSLGAGNFHKYMESFIKNYIWIAVNGFTFPTSSIENMLVDGRLTDTESLDLACPDSLVLEFLVNTKDFTHIDSALESDLVYSSGTLPNLCRLMEHMRNTFAPFKPELKNMPTFKTIEVLEWTLELTEKLYQKKLPTELKNFLYELHAFSPRFDKADIQMMDLLQHGLNKWPEHFMLISDSPFDKKRGGLFAFCWPKRFPKLNDQQQLIQISKRLLPTISNKRLNPLDKNGLIVEACFPVTEGINCDLGHAFVTQGSFKHYLEERIEMAHSRFENLRMIEVKLKKESWKKMRPGPNDLIGVSGIRGSLSSGEKIRIF
jgi:hypothetical protein